MGYLILGIVTISLFFGTLIECLQDLGTRVSRLERENMKLRELIDVLEYKEDDK